jgi:Tfp pilus assembly protein PilN
MFNLDSALGIEIVDDKLFFTIVKKRYQGYYVQGRMVLKNYSDMPAPELYGRVQHFISQHSFNRDNVILGIPRDEVILRYITLPQEVEENLDQVAQLQFRKYEPNEDVASYLDYSVVDRNEMTGRIKLRVSMVARSLVDRYLNLLNSWHLYPYSVRVSSTGLMSTLAVHRDGFPEKDPVLIYRIAEGKAEAIMVVNGQEFYSEVFYMKPGQDITADWLMMETTSLVSRLSVKVKRLNKVYMTGNVSQELFSELASRLGDVAYLCDGIDTAELNLKKPALEEKITSVGMALSGLEKSGRKRLNLIPPSKRLIGGTPSLVATALLVILLMAVGIGWATQGYFQEKKLLDQIENQIQVMQTEVDEVFRLRGEVQVKQEEVELLRSLMSKRQATLLILKDLSERVPEDSYFRTFKISGNDVEIQGSGSRASSLVPILADSPYLDAVKTNWIRADSRDAGKERFSFSATIEGTEGDSE